MAHENTRNASCTSRARFAGYHLDNPRRSIFALASGALDLAKGHPLRLTRRRHTGVGGSRERVA